MGSKRSRSSSGSETTIIVLDDDEDDLNSIEILKDTEGDDDDIEFLCQKTCSPNPNKRPKPTGRFLEKERKGVLFSSKKRLLEPKIVHKVTTTTTNITVPLPNSNAEPVPVSTFPLNELPNELLSEVLGSITNQSDLISCRQVSKTWNELSCIHLRNVHQPIQLERLNQIKALIDTTIPRRRIEGQRFPFTRFNLNLVTLSRRSLEFMLAQPSWNIQSLSITTDGHGPSYGKSKDKDTKKDDEQDTVRFLLERCPDLVHLTIDLHPTVSSNLSLVNNYVNAITKIPSLGLTNISFSPTAESLGSFRQLTGVQGLHLTKLKVDLRKLFNTNSGMQKEMLDMFSHWLETMSSTLVDLGVHTSLNGVRVPSLPKLKALALLVNASETHGLETFGTFTPSHFPLLEKLHLGSFILRKTSMKYDCGIQAFVGDIFPTIESLTLEHMSPEGHYDNSFPNIKKLKVGPNVNLFHLRNIISYFLDVEVLSIRLSSVARDWWGALTGEAKRRQRQSLVTTKAIVDVENERILGGPRRGACCLGHLYELKSLTFENSNIDVLDALVYLTANKFIRPLEKLVVATTEILEYPEDLLQTLRSYHRSVTVE